MKTIEERLDDTLSLYQAAIDQGWAATRIKDLRLLSDDVLRLIAEANGIGREEIGL